MDIDVGGFRLKQLGKINVILGKNGCGKSYLMKQVEQGLQNLGTFGRVRYISPERGGLLRYEPNIDENLSNNPRWMQDTRRRNQSENFRQQSATLFRRLELAELRGIEASQLLPNHTPRSFDATIEKLNFLLDRVRLERDLVKAFQIIVKDTGAPASPEEISSGESELISLGIEFLAFLKEMVEERANVLLVDEPDVHLHPDLQDRFARFVVQALKEHDATVILASHSTALVASLAESEGTRITFMRRGDSELDFRAISDVDRALLPMFGAHPLSNVFNRSPALLVEGEDDERVWQQVVRSSNGRVRVFPCVVGTVSQLSVYEAEVDAVIRCVYDDARAFSLRDGDGVSGAIDDLGVVKRLRLECYSAENLMLSDEALGTAGTNWEDLQGRIKQWVTANQEHMYHSEMADFVARGLDRKDFRLKNIRNILAGLISSKPWEVLVGKAIAAWVGSAPPVKMGTLAEYLGTRVCVELLQVESAVPLGGTSFSVT